MSAVEREPVNIELYGSCDMREFARLLNLIKGACIKAAVSGPVTPDQGLDDHMESPTQILGAIMATRQNEVQ